MIENKNERQDGYGKESKEAFTDSVEIIGPEDKEKSVEALPVSCGIVTISNKESNVAGIIHISLGAGFDGTQSLVDEAHYKLKKQDLSLSDVQLRALNVGETIEEELRKSLKRYNVDFPNIEFMQKTGVRIYKNGSLEFFDP